MKNLKNQVRNQGYPQVYAQVKAKVVLKVVNQADAQMYRQVSVHVYQVADQVWYQIKESP